MSHPVEPAGAPPADDVSPSPPPVAPSAFVLLDEREPGDGAPVPGDPADGADPVDGADQAGRADEITRDWRWIEEWREGGEPTPWAYGVGVAVFAALVAMAGVMALSGSLAGQPWLAVIVNLVVAAGLAPALWLCRGLPVLRWLAAGVAVGVVTGWVGSLAVIPAP